MKLPWAWQSYTKKEHHLWCTGMQQLLCSDVSVMSTCYAWISQLLQNITQSVEVIRWNYYMNLSEYQGQKKGDVLSSLTAEIEAMWFTATEWSSALKPACVSTKDIRGTRALSVFASDLCSLATSFNSLMRDLGCSCWRTGMELNTIILLLQMAIAGTAAAWPSVLWKPGLVSPYPVRYGWTVL